MASSAVMADFGRLPASRKVLLFAVIGVLLAGLYYRFVYASLSDEVAEARGSYEATQRTHATNVANLKKYEELRPAMDQLRAQLARNQAALPTEAEVPAFFETLERKVKESGVEISKWTKRAEEPIESFVKVPVEIEITGTFMQIKRFFASLVQKNITANDAEERERIVSIDSLVISQPQVRNREIILTAKFVAVTFRQDARATGKSGGAGSGGPALPPPLRPGSGATSATGGAAGALRQGGDERVDQLLGSGAGAERLKKGM